MGPMEPLRENLHTYIPYYAQLKTIFYVEKSHLLETCHKGPLHSRRAFVEKTLVGAGADALGSLVATR